MEGINFSELFTTGGISLTIAGIAYKAIGKLYSDMREDSTKREDKLMSHLEKQSETTSKIAVTLEKMDGRICTLEEYCRENKGGV